MKIMIDSILIIKKLKILKYLYMAIILNKLTFFKKLQILLVKNGCNMLHIN